MGLLEGLVQVCEPGDELVDAGEGEDAEQDGVGVDDQQQLATCGHGSLMSPYEHAHRGRLENRVPVMFTTTVSCPQAAVCKSIFRKDSALAASISCGAVTTGTPPITTMGYQGSVICATSWPSCRRNREPAAWLGHTRTAGSQNAGPAASSTDAVITLRAVTAG
jgi:hypothetical protein